MKIKVKRYCEICHSRLQKRGKDKYGKQRRLCPKCNVSFHRERHDVKQRHTLNIFVNWITNSASKNQLKIRRHKDWKRFAECYGKIPQIEPCLGEYFAIVVIDAIWLRTGKKDDERVCLIACSEGHAIPYLWVKSETTENWDKLFRTFNIHYTIVCDGHRGMLVAIRRRWPRICIQRCLVHIKRNIISKISKHPGIEAGEYLLSLVNDLMNIRNENEMKRWISAFKNLYAIYYDFVNEWSFGINESGKKFTWRKHKKLRSAFKEIEHEISMGTLFPYLINPNIPKQQTM